MKSQKSRLVVQYLEGVAGAVLDEYPDVVREFVRNRNGVYALYKGDRLYYAGLARNLRSRLRGHMRDRHAKKWDRFSIYLTEGDEHLKELEALVLRIAEPQGNRVTGQFPAAEDLTPKLRRKLRERKLKEVDELTGEPKRVNQRRISKPAIKALSEMPKCLLGRYFKMTYKGKVFIAHVRKDGAISFARGSADWQRLRGKLYQSPSAAAKAVMGHSANGWWWWKFRTSSGEWVRLSELRAGRLPA